jgi:DNA topoisomerase-1
MNAIKRVGKFKIMSIGRVQGPTLNLIVKKEFEIKNFKSATYWQVFIKLKDFDFELKYVKDIFHKKDLEKFKDLVGKEIKLETKKTEQIILPNPPMNLTTLQTESYRLFGITPSNTLKIAQSLYLAGLISYPRTSSQKLPASIDYKSILEKLKEKYKITKLIKRDKPVEGAKTDPAHPSIFPTGNFQILSGDEEKIYDLIVKRFLALFCEDAVVERKKIIGKVNDLEFSIAGSSIKKKAWLEIYPLKVVETNLPDANGKKEITSLRTEEKETQPPKRYSQASIILELEKRNLGTKATRASILETLYDRDYIKEKSIEATPLVISLIKTLEKYSPIILDEKLTRDLQKEIDAIVEKNDEKLKEKEQKILEKSKEIIIKIINDFKDKEELIGNELVEAQEEQREMQRKENILALCPKCQKGNLIINYSKKYKKHFVACDSYPDCKNTYSLPLGMIKKAGKNCEQCGYPALISLRKEKRPWVFCFNPLCESNRERMQAYKEKRGE